MKHADRIAEGKCDKIFVKSSFLELEPLTMTHMPPEMQSVSPKLLANIQPGVSGF